MKILKYSLILFIISIVVIGILIFMPYRDYQDCMDWQENWEIWDGEFRDTESICKEMGFYLQEIDGVLYDSKTNIPFTGEITSYESTVAPVYLIYGYLFAYRVMNYKDGKLDGWTTYFDRGFNPVLLEWYESGVLMEQQSGVHEAVDRDINYGPKCKPADDSGWRSCPTMGKE